MLLSLVVSEGALAYQRSMTCGPPPNRFRCDEGEEPKPVSWFTSCVVIHVNTAGSAELPFEEIVNVSKTAMDIWDRVECSYFTPIFGGYTDEDRVGFNPYSRDNANVFVFRDSGWRHSAGVIALTSVTFAKSTAEIVDADIEFNAQHYEFTTTTQTQLVKIDLLNTMVHEVGHLVGLDHSAIPESTMFSSAPEGELQKQSLHSDDIAGFCEAYPTASAEDARICNRHGIGFYNKPDLAMDELPMDAATCSSVPLYRGAPARTAGLTAALTLLLGLSLLRSSRHKPRG